MESVLEIVSIMLAVASTTLAIAAFVFSWVVFRETAKAQRDIHTVLATVDKKVDVVSERTSRQMDKTWDLLAGVVSPPLPKNKDASLIEERSQRAIQSAVQEIMSEVKSSAASGDTSNSDEELSGTIGKKLREASAEVAVIGQMQTLSLDIDHIESLLRQLLSRFHVPAQIDESFEDLLESRGFLLSDKVISTIRELLDFRDRAISDTTLSPSDFRNPLALASQVRNYFASYILKAPPVRSEPLREID